MSIFTIRCSEGQPDYLQCLEAKEGLANRTRLKGDVGVVGIRRFLAGNNGGDIGSGALHLGQELEDVVEEGVLNGQHVFGRRVEQSQEAALGIVPRVGSELGEGRWVREEVIHCPRINGKPTFFSNGFRLVMIRDIPNSKLPLEQ